MNLTEEQLRVALKALRSQPVQMLMGAEEWDLTEQEEKTLWTVIEPPATHSVMLVSAADFAQIQAVIDAPVPAQALIDLFNRVDPEWIESNCLPTDKDRDHQ